MGKGGAPTASRGAAARVVTMLEVDPADYDPALLDAIRKKNSAALPLTSILDPHKELCAKGSSNADDVAWYLITNINGHHMTGNLNMLTDLTPVFDRWVSCLVGSGPPMQVRARGSVNCNGIKLNDVWYVPECKVNVVSAAQIGLILSIGVDDCTIERHDGVTVGKGRRKDNLYELEFVDATSVVPWYIVSHDWQPSAPDELHPHPTRPLSPDAHWCDVTGVWHWGPEVQRAHCPYAPGLSENIVSVSQLTFSGFSVMFGPRGCTVTRNRDEEVVGAASHSGGLLYQLQYLNVDSRK